MIMIQNDDDVPPDDSPEQQLNPPEQQPKDDVIVHDGYSITKITIVNDARLCLTLSRLRQVR